MARNGAPLEHRAARRPPAFSDRVRRFRYARPTPQMPSSPAKSPRTAGAGLRHTGKRRSGTGDRPDMAKMLGDGPGHRPGEARIKAGRADQFIGRRSQTMAQGQRADDRQTEHHEIGPRIAIGPDPVPYPGQPQPEDRDRQESPDADADIIVKIY